MAKVITSNGQYQSPQGQAVSYEFQYESFDSLQDAIATLGEPEALKSIQRMVKVDANNTAREKAKVANGHSVRKAMTEEQKASAKKERQTNAAILKALSEKGVKSLEDLKAIL